MLALGGPDVPLVSKFIAPIMEPAMPPAVAGKHFAIP
jgi:hypothetical protein